MACYAESHPYHCGCSSEITPDAAPAAAPPAGPVFRRSTAEGASAQADYADSPGAQLARHAGQPRDAELDAIAEASVRDRMRGHRTADGTPRDQAEVERLWRHARAAAARGSVVLDGPAAEIARQVTMACPDLPMSVGGADEREPAWSKVVVADDHGNYLAGSLSMYQEMARVMDMRAQPAPMIMGQAARIDEATR